MGSALAEAHIVAQERLRRLTVAAAAGVWVGLPGYDEENVADWLARIVPLVTAAQRQSAALTETFLARAVGRQPLGIDRALVTGAGVRAGVDPETVYRRPFVTVWTALQNGTAWDAAVAAGKARATSTAATDVQLAMRGTLREVGQADDVIVGYQRVPDGGACEFCVLVSGQRYHSDDLMPIHNHCGCGVDVITRENRRSFTGQADNDVPRTADGSPVEIREHGELGPVLVNGDHDFTQL